ncbi:hypothetical protein JXB37_02470 [candidate division WOR-3 bacterium]|nr:hypothetical protein [candidate division WOR-3 bacterium]
MRRLVLVVLLAVAAAAAFELTDSTRYEPRVDYDLGLVFIEKWWGSRLVGVEKVITLDDYLDYQLKQSISASWRTAARQSRQQKELAYDASGLIPDITLPKLPVFGEGSKIDISGQDRITLGGRQTLVEGAGRTPTGQRLLPELKMEQQLAVRLDGTVGERTKVSIDHDSERQEGKNKIKLSYTGTEDEIVQSVELGDTRLSIPGTQYTGDLPAHKGLFGASAQGKLAGVDVYAIASREESQGQTQSFTGQRRVSVDTIYGKEYVRNRFFHVEAPGELVNLRVYVDDKNPTNNQASLKGIATVYPDYPDSIPARWNYDRAGGDFDLKSIGTDFVVHPGNIVEFARSVDPQAVVGLVIFTATDTIGGGFSNDSLVMKLLKPEIPDSSSLAWDYELRNVYALPLSEVQLGRVSLVRYNPDDNDDEYEDAGPCAGRKFLEILGLDPNNDGRIEYPQFDSRTGLIRFPSARPFASSDLSVPDSVIYLKYPLDADEGRRYYLVVEYSSATESFYLGQVDIEDGSEKVYVNGDLWSRNTDYEINYLSGMLTFRRELPPDADIRVTFEYRPWFSLTQKSLVGSRAEWKFDQNGKVGSSIFYRSEGVPDDRPVLGSEPFQRMIAEADASYNTSSDAVSAFLDRLPLLRAQAPTTFSAQLEGALSVPDPNTRGVAYLDDFEGTTITRDVSTNAILWYHASVPAGKDSAGFAETPLHWVTPVERVRKDSVFGPSIGDEGRETQDYLRVVFSPDPGDTASWAGMMTSPSQLGMNLQDIENLQVILKSRRGAGRIHVSVGMSIDEDAPRRDRAGRIVGLNGRLDTEDENGNGILDEAIEDAGLDGVFGYDSLWHPDSADDGNDDYDVETNPGGTEDNRRLDSEDLDRNGFSRYNHYFECELELGDERYVSPLYGGWQLYRVSLKDSAAFRVIGDPKWENIKVVRVWFDGFEATDTVDFYSVEFVGSKWRDPLIGQLADSTNVPVDTAERVWVAQISRKTDTTYYPPFEPETDIYGNVEQEASLLFGYRNLHGNRQAVVARTNAERDDYREYAELRLWAHNDGNDLGVLLRVGSDSLNYYQYRALVTDGDSVPGAGRQGWYEFVVPLDSLPVLKPRRDSAVGPGGEWQAGRYGVTGNPSLADVRYTGLGIENRGRQKLSGGIWFDDLRLAGPRKDPGYGFTAGANFGLSDLATVGVNLGYSDPNFRRFSEGRGVKTGGYGTNLGTSVRANLDRLLPVGWGLSIPLSYGISQRTSLPKFSSTYPDLRVEGETGAEELATARDEYISLDNVRKSRSGNRLMNYTVEAMSFSWRERRAGNRATLTRDSTSSRLLQWSYGVSPDLSVTLGEETDLALFPQGINLGLANSSQRTARASRQAPGDSWRVDTLRGNGLSADFGVDYSPIDELSFDYGLGLERDLLVGEDTLVGVPLGSESDRDENFGASFSYDIGDFLTPTADFDGDYSHERPKASDTAYAGYRNMSNSGDLDVGLGLDLPELFELLGNEPPKREKQDDSLAPPPSSAEALRKALRAVGGAVDPVDFDYSISRSSDLVRVVDNAPWHYRLGFTDGFQYDSLEPPTSVDRDRLNSLRLSSGLRVKEVKVGVGYDWSVGRNTNLLTTQEDRSLSWPDLDYSLGKLHNLFSKYATDSRLNGRYSRRTALSGELLVDADSLAMYGRTQTTANEFSPLISWQTTWKKRVSTTLSANYTFSSATSFLSETGLSRSVTDTDTRGADLSLSYSFSAPQGLRLPFLKRVRFSSDLRLTWSLRYARTLRTRTQWTGGLPEDPVPQQNDNSVSTRLAASYSFSRTIEAGANVGYGYTKGLTGTSTKTADLDFWVLFRF